MIQDGPHLFYRHTWKPFDKLIDTASVFEIFEKSRNRNTCTTKNPGATYSFRITLNYGTSRPIQHAVIVARE